ncbi:putative protein kinase [Trypanosoma rangeli]|uniref:Protein kinase domain-containing protein n=1 Tax=Trypanosoma rangeli TaxID=5698 RepID=A0A422P4L8_TRYRA|nr:putative protein kinase [Trypanosoma rangeli]RNF12663.1 putative protein kinase [Trypanosoma rangeli]|eukprot:RNF12663.1 putative protein kinase [Trypanosoma rangeli]
MEHVRKTNKKLGVGARGVVYEGYDAESGRFVAVKEIPFFDGGGVGTGDDAAEEDPVLAEERRAIVREITLMERFEHPNLVTYYGARRSAVGVQIIMEFINGGSLDALIRRQGSLRESVVRSYTHDILEGLAYLHDTARVCHRDVKPANVLITADGRCKLTDFGVSKLLDDTSSMRTTVGTPWYMAPEVVGGDADDAIDEDAGESQGDIRSGCSKADVKKLGYTTSADIWSLGVTVFEMISGKKPFGGEMRNPAAVLFAIAAANGTPPRLPDNCEASASLRAFLDLCFVRDARLRPKAKELLSHQWFGEVSGGGMRGGIDNTRRLGAMPSSSQSDAGLLRTPPNMLDTADIMDRELQAPLSIRTRMSLRREAARQMRCEVNPVVMLGRPAPCVARDENTQCGFFSSDGHYVDLPHAPPLLLPYTRGKES